MIGKKHTIDIVTGIDIGSTAIRIAVAQVDRHATGKQDIQIIATAEVASEGVHRGVVNSIEDTVSSISGALEQAERMVGIPIEHAWVGLTGTHTQTQESKGVIAVAKSDGEISAEDVDRVVEAARAVTPPLNYETLHVVPRHFIVDGQTGIKDPTGMTGIRLEVDTKIIHGMTTHLNNLSKAIYRAGIDIDDLVFSILAAGDVVTTSRQKDLGVAVVNIGGAVTSLVVYEEGDIIHTAVFPIGSEHVTNDLAIGLRTSIDIAERVKIHFGHCVSSDIPKKDQVDLSSVGAPGEEHISHRYIAEIIEARMRELLEKIDEELVKVNRSGLLPAGVMFTGGGSKVSGLVACAKEQLRLSVALGYPIDMTSATDKINDLGFTTAIGLAKWGAELQQGAGGRKKASRFSVTAKTLQQVRGMFRSLIP